MEDVGLNVDVAMNGREAIDSASTHRYDLIVMDMQMPDLDGLQPPARSGSSRVTPRHRSWR